MHYCISLTASTMHAALIPNMCSSCLLGPERGTLSTARCLKEDTQDRSVERADRTASPMPPVDRTGFYSSVNFRIWRRTPLGTGVLWSLNLAWNSLLVSRIYYLVYFRIILFSQKSPVGRRKEEKDKKIEFNSSDDSNTLPKQNPIKINAYILL